MIFPAVLKRDFSTQYDDSGVPSFHFKNYYPSQGTVEYRKKF